MARRFDPMRYHAAIEYLASRIDYEQTRMASRGTPEFKLARMRRLLELLGNPERGLPVVHVAGTKGKGSTSALIASALSAGGYRTGVYSSPHLHHVEERFAIDGLRCPESNFISLVDTLRPVVQQMDQESGAENPGPTYFELTTAMALMHFARSKVDAVVLEVGLGGRLDSTNVCQPCVCVITNVSLDHTQQLGNTLASIAREKAGIVKSGVPVVSGVLPNEPRQVVQEICRQRRARLIQLGEQFDYTYQSAGLGAVTGELAQIVYHDRDKDHLADCEVPRKYSLGLLGQHQGANAAVALATLEVLKGCGWNISQQAIHSGFAGTRLPARMQILSRQPWIITDGAHNTASIAALIDTLRECFESNNSFSRRFLVFGTSRDKDHAAMLRLILEHFDHVVLTRYVNNSRGIPPESLMKYVPVEHRSKVTICTDPKSAWKHISEHAGREDLVCVAGSFFLAAEMETIFSASEAVPLI